MCTYDLFLQVNYKFLKGRESYILLIFLAQCFKFCAVGFVFGIGVSPRFSFFKKNLFIYLTVPGLRACELLVAASLTRDGTQAPCIGSSDA